MNTGTVDQIIRYCDAHGEDAARTLQKYFVEKDSRLSLLACKTIIEKRRRIAIQPMPEVCGQRQADTPAQEGRSIS